MTLVSFSKTSYIRQTTKPAVVSGNVYLSKDRKCSSDTHISISIMKFLSSQLSILAGALSTFALSNHVGTVPQRVTEACPFAQILSSSTVNVHGQDVVLQVLSCPVSNFTSSPCMRRGCVPLKPNTLSSKRAELPSVNRTT